MSKAKEYLKDQRYTEEDQGEGYILTVSELAYLLNDFGDNQNKELIECRELLQRIFNHHISYGFGDDGLFESFADEITDLL